MIGYEPKRYEYSTKKWLLRKQTRHNHQGKADEPKQDILYSAFNRYYTPLYHASDKIMVVSPKRIGKKFVPKFYHDRKHNNFLKNYRQKLTFVEICRRN